MSHPTFLSPILPYARVMACVNHQTGRTGRVVTPWADSRALATGPAPLDCSGTAGLWACASRSSLSDNGPTSDPAIAGGIVSDFSEGPLLIAFIDFTRFAVEAQRRADAEIAGVMDAYYELAGARRRWPGREVHRGCDPDGVSARGRRSRRGGTARAQGGRRSADARSGLGLSPPAQGAFRAGRRGPVRRGV